MKRASSVTQLSYGLILAAMAMRFASSDTANLSYLVLAIYALFGRAQAIQALALSCLFTMLSEGVAPLATAASVGRYAVIVGAAISVLLCNGPLEEGFSINRSVFATLALGAFLIVHSVLFSLLPDVSILKAVSWTIVMATLLSAWSGLSYEARMRLERQLFGGLIALILVSLPLAFTATGYLRNGTGFQGVLNHPQAFGPTAAVLGAWLGGRLLGAARPRWFDMALLGLCLALVVLSEARTAGLALVLGLASAVLVSPFIAGIPARRLMPGLASLRLHVLALMVTVALMFVGTALSDRLGDYMLKRGGAVSLLEIADASRGAVVYPMIANIEKKPWTGIGFGIASDPSSMQVDRDPVLGLPTGASIEKGVLPFAVLEELGILGFLLVVAWLWPMARRGARSGIAAFAVLTTLLLTNLGESTLFSPGGMGLFLLILLAWAVTGRHYPMRNRIHGRNLVLAKNR